MKEPTLRELGLDDGDDSPIPIRTKPCSTCGTPIAIGTQECESCSAIRASSSTGRPTRLRESIAELDDKRPFTFSFRTILWLSFAIILILVYIGSPRSTSTSNRLPSTNAKVLTAELAPFQNPTNGKVFQEVIVTWINTGEEPIRVVDAHITALSNSGSRILDITYTIYAESDSKPGVMPGEAYTDKKGEGFKLPGFAGLPGYEPASSVSVEIVSTATQSGM